MDEFLRIIAARAATFDERLAEAVTTLTESATDLQAGLRRFTAWRESSVGGDFELFDRRLARDGFCKEDVLQKLSATTPLGAAPAWLEAAEWVDCALRKGGSAAYALAWRGGEPEVPFEDLFCGVVEEAERRLVRTISPHRMDLLSESAMVGLRLELAHSLAGLCGPIFYQRFRLQRDVEPRADAANDERAALRAFVVHMRSEGLRAVFLQRPVLLRLLAVVVAQWVAATVEFAQRLHADQAALAMLTRAPGGHVVACSEVVGDLHNHGRAVRSVVFTNEAKVFYKPKNLAIDGAWSELILDLNARAPPFQLRTPRTLARTDYGWSEHIEHDPCEEPGGFAAYFRRAGGWLCLFHLFGGMDMHEQNIVASGEHPVPVDLETLLQPSQIAEMAEADPRRAYTLAGAAIAGSVLSTGLLPGYGRRERHGEAIAHGGFLETRVRERRIGWLHVNTDRMRPVVEFDAGRSNENLPHADGAYGDIKDFVGDVVAGYVEYANYLLGGIRARGVEDLIGRFSDVKVRKLIKNTRFYSLLVDRLRNIHSLEDGGLWSAHLDFVCRFVDWNAPDDPWWPLVEAERNALAELNVPYFTMSAKGSTIADVDGLGAESGLQPGLDRARSALAGLGEAEIERQANIVRLSLTSVRSVEVALQVRASRRSNSTSDLAIAGDASLLKARADTIASDLALLAYRGQESAAWLGLDWLEDSTICQLAPLGTDLYNGAVGVAVFLAAHARVAANEQSARLARAGISALRHDLLGVNAGRSARAVGIGGSTGLGSIVYGLSTIADLVDDQAVLADAVQISRLLSDELIGSDTSLDAMDGAAGALLGLLKLYRLTGDTTVLERARACGRHLLSAETAHPNVISSGLSHGPAGMALALAGLAAELPQSEAFDLFGPLQEWLDLENATFCDQRRAWPDARSNAHAGSGFWPCQWCHGGAGIGLARIATADSLRASRAPARLCEILDRDIVRAVETTKAAWSYATDSLCCGSLGGIELLVEAGRHLAAPDLQSLGRARLFETVAEADRAGDYLWDIADRSVNVGLFRGISGVGYTLLRQLDPTLPNILVWG